MNILGTGARRLLMMQVCKAIGAGPIIMKGLDRDETYRLAMAKELGCDYVIHPGLAQIKEGQSIAIGVGAE